jgi:hypothetical protein
MGGRITSPRATDKERLARKLHISRHDIAGLASQEYHGGKHGIPDLSISFVHACDYRSFSPLRLKMMSSRAMALFNYYTKRLRWLG